jgi:hypothetical protein
MMGIWVPETCRAVPKNNKVFKWHLVGFLFSTYIDDARTHPYQIFFVCFISILYMFRALCAHHQENYRDADKSLARPSAKIRWKSSSLDFFLGSRRYPSHRLTSKGPKYQREVLLISAGLVAVACFLPGRAKYLSAPRVTVSMRHLVFVTLCGWPSGVQDGMTVNSPDDGHIAPETCTE